MSVYCSIALQSDHVADLYNRYLDWGYKNITCFDTIIVFNQKNEKYKKKKVKTGYI